jgi:hypothetical protein
MIFLRGIGLGRIGSSLRCNNWRQEEHYSRKKGRSPAATRSNRFHAFLNFHQAIQPSESGSRKTITDLQPADSSGAVQQRQVWDGAGRQPLENRPQAVVKVQSRSRG